MIIEPVIRGCYLYPAHCCNCIVVLTYVKLINYCIWFKYSGISLLFRKYLSLRLNHNTINIIRRIADFLAAMLA